MNIVYIYITLRLLSKTDDGAEAIDCNALELDFCWIIEDDNDERVLISLVLGLIMDNLNVGVWRGYSGTI